jgi:hypothetical protein
MDRAGQARRAPATGRDEANPAVRRPAIGHGGRAWGARTPTGSGAAPLVLPGERIAGAGRPRRGNGDA